MKYEKLFILDFTINLFLLAATLLENHMDLCYLPIDGASASYERLINTLIDDVDLSEHNKFTLPSPETRPSIRVRGMEDNPSTRTGRVHVRLTCAVGYTRSDAAYERVTGRTVLDADVAVLSHRSWATPLSTLVAFQRFCALVWRTGLGGLKSMGY
jgi:hypothetical protein